MKKNYHQSNINPTREFYILSLLSNFALAGFILFPPIYFSIIGLGDAITSFIQFGIVLFAFISSFFLANLRRNWICIP